MKNFRVSKSSVALAALILLLGLALGVSEVQQATAGDSGIGSGEPIVIAAQRGAPQAVVPNLIGKNKAETQMALAKAGLTLGEVKFTTSGKGKPGTVVKQKPKPKTKVAKGSAVDVMMLKADAKISPKIVQKGEKVFMEFPEPVKDVIISDAKGKKLQQFKKGKRFDITESVIATKAGRIKVAFTPPFPLPVDAREGKHRRVATIDIPRVAFKDLESADGTGPSPSKVSFCGFFYNGSPSPGQCCTNWNNFRGLLTETYSEIVMWGTNDPTGVTCTGAAAAAICSALHTGTYGSWFCGDNIWEVGICGGVELTATGHICSCNNPGYTLRPCIINANWGGINTATCFPPTQMMCVMCR